MKYDPVKDQFVSGWKLGKIGTGAATLRVSIGYAGTASTTEKTLPITDHVVGARETAFCRRHRAGVGSVADVRSSTLSPQEEQMFATIRRYRLDSGSMDALLHAVDVGFAEMIEQKDGFVAYEVLDCGNGMVTTISTFSDRDAAEATTEAAASWIRDNLADFDMERLSVETGEIAVNRAREEMLVPAHH